MKKILLILPLAAMLNSCGGGQSTQNVSTTSNNSRDEQPSVHTTENETETIASPLPDHNIAYEVSKKINTKTPTTPPADTANKLEYSFEFEAGENYDLNPIATIRCIPNTDGGYVVIYQEKEEGVLGDGYIESIGKFDVYLYKDGNLTAKNDLLPRPTFADFQQQDAVIMMGKGNPISSKDKLTYYLEADNRLAVCTDFDTDYTTVYYKWNGKQFSVCNNCESKRSVKIISGKGLGEIHLGDNAPNQIKGFDIEKSGNNLIYKRFGKKYFTLSLSKDNKIDTIQVHTWLYAFPMVGMWGSDYYNVGFSPVDDCFGDQSDRDEDYFIFKKGTWVRHVEIDGGTIEFITTPNAIDDGAEGKIVMPQPRSYEDSNIANFEEKVTLIKIYKSAPFCETCVNNSDQDNVNTIRKMYNIIATDPNLTKKHIEIEDAESGYPCDYNYFYKDNKLVMVEFSSGDGVMKNIKIYLKDDYPFFCFALTTYPDNTKNEERIYMCAGKIFKFLDNNKKEVNINSDDVARTQTQLNTILQTAKNNESKAQ